MIRLALFIIALLLAVGALEATDAWLITVAVLAGVGLLFSSGKRLGLRRLRGWVGSSRWDDDW
ncbi:MAG: hypothetical protein IIB87_05050 [Chloroflexi bacterium]|nr:hypothetical protein [Chloroflexota bacterium]